MEDTPRLSPDDHENLVAYIDGELDEEAMRRVEQLLARSPEVRREVELLSRAFDMLDVLPSERASETFATRTLTNIRLQAVPKSASSRLFASKKQLTRTASWLAGLVLSAACGFFVTYRWISPPTPESPSNAIAARSTSTPAAKPAEVRTGAGLRSPSPPPDEGVFEQAATLDLLSVMEIREQEWFDGRLFSQQDLSAVTKVFEEALPQDRRKELEDSQGPYRTLRVIGALHRRREGRDSKTTVDRDQLTAAINDVMIRQWIADAPDAEAAQKEVIRVALATVRHELVQELKEIHPTADELRKVYANLPPWRRDFIGKLQAEYQGPELLKQYLREEKPKLSISLGFVYRMREAADPGVDHPPGPFFFGPMEKRSPRRSREHEPPGSWKDKDDDRERPRRDDLNSERSPPN